MLRTALLLVAALASVTPVSNARAAEPDQSEQEAKPAMNRSNPFFEPSPLPFHAPPFDRIELADFRPAFERGMQEQLAEVHAITADPAPPTFANTLVALERSGQLLERVSLVFNALTSADTNPELQQLEQAMAPELAAHRDAIFLDDKLFARIEALWKQRAELELDAESARLLEYYHDEFIHSGARLSAADKERLSNLNAEEASLTTRFSNQLLAADDAGALVIAERPQLAGLSDDAIAAAAAVGEEKGWSNTWVIPLQNTTQQPALASLDRRDVRQQLFTLSWTRTEHGDANDTRALILRLVALRAEKAKLLGYDTYAAWKLADQMAKTPAAVTDFLAGLVPAATAKARHEAADIQAAIEKSGGDFQLAPWDWNYYAEAVRRARYDLDESQIKPYLELDRVLRDGVFYAAHELYGLTFTERHDLPVYHPDVRVFEVHEADGSPLGLYYLDPYARPSKAGGAWMDSFVGQSKLLGTKPVVFNVTNVPKPAPGQPTLLTWDEVTTLFHEFGHALHGLFADQQYPSLSGTAVARDFVEFPSQFNEHWALDPTVFAHYAVHHETGKPMPAELVSKIRRSATFNQGYALTEILAASSLDMSWHTLAAGTAVSSVDRFEATALAQAGLALPAVPPRYRSSYFAHIFGGDYAAGYYAYLWSEMLDDDAYAWFVEHGGLTRANGQRFRDLILSRGRTEDYGEMFRRFRGRDPILEPLLENRGLVKEQQPAATAKPADDAS